MADEPALCELRGAHYACSLPSGHKGHHVFNRAPACPGCAAKDRQIEELLSDCVTAGGKLVAKDEEIARLQKKADWFEKRCYEFVESEKVRDAEICQLNAQKQSALDLLAKFAHTDKIVEALTK